MNLANKLTVARVIAVPFFIFMFIKGLYFPAALIFALASITDFLDGQIARRNNLVTNFGKIMDPLADKILVYSALCLLIDVKAVPAWTLIVILAREFIVSGMRTVAASEGIVISAGMSGKLKTLLQMVAVEGLILSLGPFPNLMKLSMWIYWAALVVTVYSGIEYIWKNKDIFKM